MSKKLLDNVYTIENAIRYLKGNIYIKDDSYSMEALHYIEKALTPPTEQEVCKALSEETGNSVYYENGKFYVHSVLWHNALSLDTLSKKSISLIGRFYDGLEKEEKE